MKKIISVLLGVAIMVASCSKEKKLNKRLDGEWEAVSYDGQTPVSGESIVLKFDKDKNGKGKYSFTYTVPSSSFTWGGTYELIDDTKISMLETDSTAPLVLLVKEYSKNDLTLTNADGLEPGIFKKK